MRSSVILASVISGAPLRLHAQSILPSTALPAYLAGEMSDERYTVILGERRYAIHRKWARLPPGESFGFLSDLMVDADGRVHVVQRGTEQPVLVFDRNGSLIGSEEHTSELQSRLHLVCRLLL